MMAMLRNLFRFSPMLLVLVLCSCATSQLSIQLGLEKPLQFNTEAGQLTMQPRDIPGMYVKGYINPEYVKFLEKIFPQGLPKKGVSTDRQHFLYRYCVVLFEQRNFAKTIECLDSVQKSADLIGDPELTDKFQFNSTGGEFPLTVREPLLRAFVLLELGNFRQSAQYADRSLQRFNDVEKKYWAGQSLVYNPWKDKFAPSLTALPSPSSEIESLSNLAVIYWLVGDSDKSDKVIAELHTRLASLGAVVGKHYSTRVRVALVRAYMTQGQYRKALEIADDDGHMLADLITLGIGVAGIALVTVGGGYSALEVGLSGFFVTFADQNTLATKFQVSHAKVEVGRYADAKPFLDEILGKEGMKALAGIYWAALYDRGRIAEHEGNLDEAVKYYRTAIDEIERQRTTINTEGAKIGFFGDKQAVYQALVRLLFQGSKFEDAFLIGERAKSRALVDMLARKQDFRIAAQDTEKVNRLLSRAQVGEVALARNTAADTELTTKFSQRSLPAGKAGEADAVALLNEVRSFKVEAREQLAAQSPELASIVTVSAVKLEDIKARLPADEALVSYYHTDGDLYAFVLTAQGLQGTKLAREGLEADVRRFRQMMDNSQSRARDVRRVAETPETDYLGLSQKLYQRLLKPLEAQLQQRQVTIVPHGILHYLPFNALHDGARFAIERYALRMLPSASTLRYLRADKSAKTGQILAFGNPDLGDPKLDLNFAQQEALEVTKTLPDSRALLRQDATKAAFREFGAQFKYLHFATHGQFNADEPLASALMLARAGKEDGRLTVSDLYSLSLDADLVTMSACETGLGKIANGDDIIGLTRGFLYAGARSVVASLWKVDDKATSTLMTRFYEKLGKTDQREALRQAQLETKAAFPHPYYWAAFQITGNAN
jgi:CHAT domain-containing protein